MISNQSIELQYALDHKPADRSYLGRIQQLSESFVRKHYLAYRDIDWNAPEHHVDRSDSRFCLSSNNPLAATSWYRELSVEAQANFGLDALCQSLKYGIGFEASLSQGLLEFASSLPNNSTEYRYALHEVMEESQHSLMFQELINRSGSDSARASLLERSWQRTIAHCGAAFPEFFFFCVLAGEVFIDHDNRDHLARESAHPLVRRIMQIHVTEEARHVRFAELFLGERMPGLSGLKRTFLRSVVPQILRDAQRMMLLPSERLRRQYGLPRSQMRACFGPGTKHRERVESIAAPVLALLNDGGRKLRLWPGSIA